MTQQEIIKKYLTDNVQYEIHGKMIMYAVGKADLERTTIALVRTHGLPLKTMFATDDRAKDNSYKVFYVFGVPKENYYIVPFLSLVDTTEFPSLAAVLPQTSVYEAHIHEMFGLKPAGYLGHLQPVVLHNNWPSGVFPMRKDFPFNNKDPKGHGENLAYQFTTVEGEGIFEVPVGPVHAGIIEPGHFRFSMAGEHIVNLEAKLGWVHKGSEKLFETLALPEKLLLSERIAGDTSFAHSTVFAMAVEELAGLDVPMRAKYLRVVYGELERLAAHLSDIGFIMSDTGYNFGGSQFTRLRERIMRRCEELTGSRFLRGVNTYGGVTHDISKKHKEELLREIDLINAEVTSILDIAKESATLENRLRGTGALAHTIAKDFNAVGVPARASGIETDARIDFPYAAYGKLSLAAAVETAGDVEARFKVRIAEVHTSFNLIREALLHMPEGKIGSTAGKLSLKKNAYAVAVSEGWRGDIVYVVATDSEGNISRVSVRDPSFINWNLVPFVAPGNVLLDFPLINKSFNLSYTGFDR